jgi:hypothetical protein
VVLPYWSTIYPLKPAQSKATSRAVASPVAADRQLPDGFGQTTVGAVAEEAGVSRKTVFTAVGGNVEPRKLALDWAVAGESRSPLGTGLTPRWARGLRPRASLPPRPAARRK